VRAWLAGVDDFPSGHALGLITSRSPLLRAQPVSHMRLPLSLPGRRALERKQTVKIGELEIPCPPVVCEFMSRIPLPGEFLLYHAAIAEPDILL